MTEGAEPGLVLRSGAGTSPRAAALWQRQWNVMGERMKPKGIKGQGCPSVSLPCLGAPPSTIRRPRGPGHFHKDGEAIPVPDSSLYLET